VRGKEKGGEANSLVMRKGKTDVLTDPAWDWKKGFDMFILMKEEGEKIGRTWASVWKVGILTGEFSS